MDLLVAANDAIGRRIAHPRGADLMVVATDPGFDKVAVDRFVFDPPKAESRYLRADQFLAGAEILDILVCDPPVQVGDQVAEGVAPV